MNATTKVFVPRTLAPLADEFWYSNSKNMCISRMNGTVLPNCFVGSTQIITSKGVFSLKKSFDYCNRGNFIDVPTIDGDWHTATVQYFGKQEIYKPWSILNYAKNKELEPYWVNTSGNQFKFLRIFS